LRLLRALWFSTTFANFARAQDLHAGEFTQAIIRRYSPDMKLERTLKNLAHVAKRAEFVVDANGHGKRIDKLVHNRLPWMRRSNLKRFVKDDRLLRNGQPCPVGRKLNEGDTVTVIFPEPWEDLAEMDEIKWETLFEDGRLLVVNKPPHLVVHPTGGYRYLTLLSAMHKHYLGTEIPEFEDYVQVPRLVHRIDKETSGVLVCAFDREAHGSLGDLFQSRDDSIEKEYTALVEGRVRWNENSLEYPLGDAPDDEIRIRKAVVPDGLYARTDVRVLERFDRFTLVRCKLFTGRTHQIRVHMAHVGHPLVGDHLYGVRDELREIDIINPDYPKFRHDSIYLDRSVSDVEASNRIRAVDDARRKEYWQMVEGKPVMREGKQGRLLLSRCALHCSMMAFPHPNTGEIMRFEAPLTADFKQSLEFLRAKGRVELG